MSRFGHTSLSLAALFFLLPSGHSQDVKITSDSPTNSADTYQDSAEGLRLQLQDLLTVARGHNPSHLKSLISEMEILNSKEWFTKTFGEDEGERWVLAYRYGLASNESDFETFIVRIENEDGEFLVRKVNDHPDPEMVVEEDLIAALQQPVDIFFAKWKPHDLSPDSDGDPIGYFMFIDGRFRWDGTINFLRMKIDAGPGRALSKASSPIQPVVDSVNGPFRPGVGGVGYPSCVFCPDPDYPKEARASHLEGTVVLMAVIQADGRPTDIEIVKTPSPDFSEKAMDAVSRWRFNPAPGRDNKPVAVIVPIEVKFRLSN